MNDSIVFVYGTLKRGYNNNYLLQDSEYLGEACTEDNFVLRNCGFPYMIDGDGPSRRVKGELYRVNDDVLHDLDALEGVDYGHYERDIIFVESYPTGFTGMCFAYIAGKGKDYSNLPLCSVVGDKYQWP